jgi:PmbA protein
VFQGEYTDYIVEFDGKKVSPQIVQVSGQAVRVIEGNNVGFHYANAPYDKGTQIEKALQSARVLDTQYQWDIAFPEKQVYPSVGAICDPAIEQADISDVVDYCLAIVEGLNECNISSKGLLYCQRSWFSLQTNTGIDVEEKSTFFTLDMDVSKEPVFNVVKSCRLWDKDSGSFVDVVKEQVKRHMPGTKNDVAKNSRFAFGSRAFYAVLRPFIWQISIDRVKRGISRIPADTVAGEVFTLYDDGTYPDGVRTSLCDGEGIASQKYSLIEKGRRNRFMYDHFHALHDNTQSTGNAVRTSMMAPPKIGPRNLVVKEGDCSLDEFTGVVIEEVVNDKGASLVSGEYVFNIKRAYYVKNGDILGAVKPFFLKGNIFDLLKNIYGTGVLKENSFPQYRELVTPYVFIQKFG